MILPNDTPESLTKSRAGPLSAVFDEAYQDHLSQPPAYPGHSSYQYQNEGLEAQPGTSWVPLIQRPVTPPAHHVRESKPAHRRLLKAFGLALLICIVLASFTWTALAGIHWRTRTDWRNIQVPFPYPSDGKIISCSSAAWGNSDRTLSSRSRSTGPVTTFLVPLSSDLLYIWGRGVLSHGTINFVPTMDHSIPPDSVRVDIRPHYNSNEALQSTNICLLTPATNQSSIAILSQREWWPTDDLTFTVDVHFPVPNRNPAPLRVKALETNLPLFTHVFSKLQDNVAFDSLKVYSANKPIHADYIDAETATIVTANGRIDGRFHVSRSLELQTYDHPIDAEVILEHDAHALGDTPTNVSLHTANAPIRSRIYLHTASPAGLGGAFAVSASTGSGAIDLSFHAQPTDSALTLSANSFVSPVSVRLHPAFEGRFELGKVTGSVSFDADEHAADPAHRERSRVWMITERTREAWRGFVSWGRADDRGQDLKGWVSVKTLNSAAQLKA